MEQLNVYFEQLIELTVAYAPKLLLAFLVLIIGFWIANRVTKLIIRAIEKTNANNKELQSFLSSIVGIGLKILVVISVAGIVGIETTSFVGIIAALGFAIGLALQGNLSNFAAGVMILLLRPFKVGDEVKIQGFWAFVKEIQIFHTVLQNFDQTDIVLPNSVIMNGTIQNLSDTPTRSISLKLMIPFEQDLDMIMKVLQEAVFSVPEVDKTKKPFFWITDHETHYMQMYAGFSAPQEGFWDTDFKVRKAVIDAFVRHQIKVPYPEGIEYGEFGKWKQQSLN